MSRTALRLLRPSFNRPIRPAYSPILSQRRYSVHADHAAPRLATLDPSKLLIERTLNPKQLVPQEQLVFGREFTGKLIIAVMVEQG
jgi:branched-chain amino acid aminotransferase